MYLILDACTVLNLLQVDLISNSDDEYNLNYNYIKRVKTIDSFQIQITEKVLEEIKKNYSKNSNIVKKNLFLKTYIEKKLHGLVDYTIDKNDFECALVFTKKVTKYSKDNGELHSTSYALYLNKYLKNTVLNSYFITDDDGAIDDFENFFKINLLGQILTTIDLLLILETYNIITLSGIFRFSSDLKKQYIKDYSNLLKEMEALQKSQLPFKESSFLTKLYENINSLDFEKVKTDIESPLYANIKRKQPSIDTLLQNILKDDLKKVDILDAKIEEIKSKYWTMDKI